DPPRRRCGGGRETDGRQRGDQEDPTPELHRRHSVPTWTDNRVSCCTRDGGRGQTFGMTRARRHPRVASFAAFALLALVCELIGRSLTERIDVGRHIASPSYAGTDYYPFLLLAVKLGIALLLARLVWRFVKAHATERAARRMVGRIGRPPE